MGAPPARLTAAAAAAADAAALAWMSEREFCGERKGEVEADRIRWACSCRWAEWARAGLMAPVDRWP